MAHVYNLSYLGGENKSISAQGQAQEKFRKTLSKKISRALWFTLIIPPVWEAELEESCSILALSEKSDSL
jgi:hypothetical protein